MSDIEHDCSINHWVDRWDTIWCAQQFNRISKRWGSILSSWLIIIHCLFNWETFLIMGVSWWSFNLFHRQSSLCIIDDMLSLPFNFTFVCSNNKNLFFLSLFQCQLVTLVIVTYLSSTVAIRVDWNTNTGPIIPPTSTLPPVPKPPFREPAPVWEDQSHDIPNPNTYT